MTSTPFEPCKDCFEGFRLDGEPKGEMGELGGLAYYLAKGKNGERGKALVLGTDIYGLAVPNPKILADLFAESTGLDIFVPDMFEGDYIDVSHLSSQPSRMEEPIKSKNIVEKVKVYGTLIYRLVWTMGIGYIKRHNKEHVYPLVEKFCTDLKREKGYGRLGWTGYCYGGMIGVHLAKDPSPVDVVVIAHPGNIAAKDFAEICKPFALVCAEEDLLFDHVKPAAVEELDKLKTPFAIYDDHPGTTHSFAIRPNLANPLVKAAFEGAMREAKEWFEKEL